VSGVYALTTGKPGKTPLADQSQDTENGQTTRDEILNGSETLGEASMSLFAQTPVCFEPGIIILEKFKIIDLLGEGGMGSVYRVEHLLMERQFALKCLNKFKSADGAWRRFQNEAKAAHLLDHANLLKVYEVGLLPGGQPFFLMELVEGETLADEIKRLGQLPVERAIKIFIQVAFALSYAHESHVIHRDIKPSNIMVSRKSPDQEIVKVVDFGIAKLTGIDEFNQQTLTKTGEIVGSPLYMSPEQCTGVSVDQRSDLYSLGCVFYEVLTGAPPFIGELALSTMMKHQGEKPLSLKEASMGSHYPLALEEIVKKLLEKDPNDRYQSARALAKDLIQLERRLNEESKSNLLSVDQTQVLKRVENKKVSQDLLSNTPTLSLLLATAALVFAAGALTGYLITGSQKQTIEANNHLYLDLPRQPKDKAEKSTKDKTSQDSDDASDSNNDKKIADLRRTLSAPNPDYDDRVKKAQRWSVIVGDKREYLFPRTEPIGQLLTDGGDKVEAVSERALMRNDLVGIVASDYLIANPSFLKKFAPDELTLLDLNASQVKAPAFFAGVGGLSQLKFLNLHETQFAPHDYPMLSKLKELRYLNVGWTNAKCKDLIAYLCPQNIQSLDVSGAEDGGQLTHNIAKFPKLRQLIMCGTGLQDKDIAALRQANLNTLCLTWNDDLTDQAIETLSGSKSIERLDLSRMHISNMCWRSLIKFPRLRKIIVSNMRWSPQGKVYFARQMQTHAPQIIVDFSSDIDHDFTRAYTDIPWLNEGCDSHMPAATLIYSRKKNQKLSGDWLDGHYEDSH